MPHLLNLDMDPFRTERFMYVFERDTTSIGAGGDISPHSISVVADHCEVCRDEQTNAVTLTAGAGLTYHNGTLLKEVSG